MKAIIKFLRWFWFSGDSEELLACRVRGEALGYALPRTLKETASDVGQVAKRKRRRVVWRRPCPTDHAAYDAIMDMFTDGLFAIASTDGETWIMGDRLFSGFPAPDMYMVIFLDSGHKVIAATEMNHLPYRWTMPPDLLTNT